jgi:hypothetical protein
MKTFSEAALKKAILAHEMERLKHGSAFGAGRSGAMRKNRQASEKILTRFLRNAGLDLDGLEAQNKARSAELKELVENHKAEAIRLASRRKGASYSDMAARAGLTRWAAPSTTLNNPFIIWSIPEIPGVVPALTPQGATAKFKFTTSEYSGWQKVGFYYLWPNPYSDYAVIDVVTTLSATGYIQAHAPWGSFLENNSSLTATSLLNLWIGWPNSNSVTSSDFYQQGIGFVWAYGSIFDGWFHDTQGESISAETYPWAGSFAVPPGGLVVFEVALELDYSNASGDVEADFTSGDFNIACPGVSFAVVNNPPLA